MNNQFLDLNNEEMMDIDGGVAPIIIVGIKIVGGGILAGAGWRLGEAAYDTVKSWF